jgi:DNA-binding winged helix-turn-helix (wHTH) protein
MYFTSIQVYRHNQTQHHIKIEPGHLREQERQLLKYGEPVAVPANNVVVQLALEEIQELIQRRHLIQWQYQIRLV